MRDPATKAEFFASLREEPAKHDRLVIANKVLFALVVGLFLAMAMAPVFAEPVFQGQGQGVTITIYNEPCKLEAVSNLPFRATWEEKGKVTEGCIAPRPEVGVVVGYFADRSIALMPIEMFQRLTGV